MTAQLNPRGDVAVLVPAAGAGVRLGPGGPKALRLLGGEPLLVHAVRRIAAAPSVGCVVVAAPPDEVDAVARMLAPVAPVIVVAGGAHRQESVAAALAAVPPDLPIVLVHDAARALAPPELFEAVAAAVRAGRRRGDPGAARSSTRSRRSARTDEVRGHGRPVAGCARCRPRRASAGRCWPPRTRPPSTRSPTTRAWSRSWGYG